MVLSIQARPRERADLRALIRRHPLSAFFTLAMLLSWVGWVPYILSDDGLGAVHFGFPTIDGTTQLLGVLPGAYAGPLLSAFLVTAIVDGRSGLRVWVGRLSRWRVRWYWYAGALIGVPAALAFTGLLLAHGHANLPTLSVVTGYVPVLLLQIATTGLAEEPGWRNFALPRLQRAHGPVRGTLILGPLWGVWHLPLFLTSWGGWPQVDWTSPVEFVAQCIAFSFVMTWVFNRTGESLPVAILAHTSVNTFFSAVCATMFPQFTYHDVTTVFLLASSVAALVLLYVTRGRLGYEPRPVGTR